MQSWSPESGGVNLGMPAGSGGFYYSATASEGPAEARRGTGLLQVKASRADIRGNPTLRGECRSRTGIRSAPTSHRGEGRR